MKKIFAPHSGRDVFFGRKRPVAKGPRFYFKSYRAGLPTIELPSSCDYSPQALPSLRNIYLNATLGCCVVAAGYHITGTMTGNTGNLFNASDDQITTDYSGISGYIPGDPSTDTGCDEQTAIDYWTETGFQDGTKLSGAITIDPENQQEIMEAVYLFENLLFGVELPDDWTNPMPSGDGFIWDIAGDPDPEQGHGYMGFGFTPDGIPLDSWALFGLMTYGAIKKYCPQSANGNLYALVSPDQIAKGQVKSPNGFAWADLIADMQEMND
jgi:hypothetical protein